MHFSNYVKKQGYCLICFKDLNDDVNILTEISTLPTTSVNKVGLIVASSVLGIGGLSMLAFILIKRRILR